MNRPGLLFLIRANLRRRPFRNAIVVICVAALTGLQAAAALIDHAGRKGIQLGIERLGADLVAVPRGLDEAITRSYLDGRPVTFYMDAGLERRIAAFPFVARTSAQVFIRSLSGAACCSAWNVMLIGFEPESDFTVRPWLAGDPRRRVGPGEALVGAALGMAAGETVRFYGRPFRVAGVLAATGMGLDSAVFIPLSSAYAMARESAAKAEAPLTLAPGQISAVAIALKPPEQGGLPPYRAAYELETALPDISVLQPDDLLVKTEHNLRRALQSLRAASYIVWPVTALLIGLVFALAANERRREFGLLRALGAERRFIFRLIFLEAMALAAAGAALGLALSTGLVLGFSRLLAESLTAPFARPGAVELFILLASAAALALATGAAAALYPAARAAGLDPYEAIRGGDS